VQQFNLTGGTTAATFGTTVNQNLNAFGRHLLAIIYSAGDTVYTTAQSPGGDTLQYSSPSLGVANQQFLVGPWNTSGPATNSSGQSMVQDLIPIEEILPPQGNEQISFALAPNATITTGHVAQVGLMYCQDYPPMYWRQQFPEPYSMRGGFEVGAQQLTTVATSLTAISIPSWVREFVACRSVIQKAGAITTGQSGQAVFNVLSTIPNVAPMTIPTNTQGATLGTPVGTGLFDDWMPWIPIYFLNPGGTQTVTPQVTLINAVSTGNQVAFGLGWR
jgi:hypothetical protein